MRLTLTCAFSLAAFVVSAAASGGTDRVANKELPPGMKLICEEHVDDFGGDGRAPTSIFWQSYAADLQLASVVRFYQNQFGSAPVRESLGGYQWKLNDGLIYAVFSPIDGSRWLRCATQPAGTGAVLLISKMSSARAP